MYTWVSFLNQLPFHSNCFGILAKNPFKKTCCVAVPGVQKNTSVGLVNALRIMVKACWWMTGAGV